jgi:diaminopimelate decarboxylase
VKNVKRQSRPIARTWIETDTSEAFLPDINIELNRWTVFASSRMDEPANTVGDVVGISCGFDMVVPDAVLPEVAEGDVLAFLDTGAYQDAGASNFNAMPRPATVLVSGDTAEVIKRAETIEDVFSRDRVPERLMARP